MLDMSTVTYLRGKIPGETLAMRLVMVRAEMGISQREAARTTGVPYGTWQGMELGRSTRNRDEHIAKIAEVTGYDRDWLMWGQRNAPGPDGPEGVSALRTRRDSNPKPSDPKVRGSLLRAVA